MPSPSRARWPCILLLVLTIADVLIADPLPFVDEAVLAGLTGLCFRKHGSRGVREPDDDEPTAA